MNYTSLYISACSFCRHNVSAAVCTIFLTSMPPWVSRSDRSTCWRCQLHTSRSVPEHSRAFHIQNIVGERNIVSVTFVTMQ